MLNAKVMKSMFESQMNPGGGHIAPCSIRPHAQRRAGCAKRAAQKSVKTVKWLFAIFQLEPAAAQSVPTKMGREDFTAFALILRLGMGGEGSRNPNLNPNLNGRRAEL
jgi:hypothetical protein